MIPGDARPSGLRMFFEIVEWAADRSSEGTYPRLCDMKYVCDAGCTEGRGEG